MNSPINDSTDQTYLAFSLTQDTYRSVHTVMEDIKQNRSANQLNKRFAEALNLLVDMGIDVYFHQPMAKVRLNSTVRKSAEAGMGVAVRGIHLLIRQLFKRMPYDQLSSFSSYAETLIINDDDNNHYVALPLSDALKSQVYGIIQRIHEDPNTHEYEPKIVDTVSQLLDLAVVYYYEKPMDIAKLRKITRKSADLAVNTAMKGIRAVIRQLFKKTRQKELIKLAEHSKELLIDLA